MALKTLASVPSLRATLYKTFLAELANYQHNTLFSTNSTQHTELFHTLSSSTLWAPPHSTSPPNLHTNIFLLLPEPGSCLYLKGFQTCIDVFVLWPGLRKKRWKIFSLLSKTFLTTRYSWSFCPALKFRINDTKIPFFCHYVLGGQFSNQNTTINVCPLSRPPKKLKETVDVWFSVCLLQSAKSDILCGLQKRILPKSNFHVKTWYILYLFCLQILLFHYHVLSYSFFFRAEEESLKKHCQLQSSICSAHVLSFSFFLRADKELSKSSGYVTNTYAPL